MKRLHSLADICSLYLDYIQFSQFSQPSSTEMSNLMSVKKHVIVRLILSTYLICTWIPCNFWGTWWPFWHPWFLFCGTSTPVEHYYWESVLLLMHLEVSELWASQFRMCQVLIVLRYESKFVKNNLMIDLGWISSSHIFLTAWWNWC